MTVTDQRRSTWACLIVILQNPLLPRPLTTFCIIKNEQELLNIMKITYSSDSQDTVSPSSHRMEKLKSVTDGWAMLPRLFMIWDEDDNGFLDEGELFAGLDNYCTARNLQVDRRAVLCILGEVDDNGDEMLDNREFAVFFARFAVLVDCCISDLAKFMIEQLEQDGQLEEDNKMKKLNKSRRGSFFSALKKKEESKRRMPLQWVRGRRRRSSTTTVSTMGMPDASSATQRTSLDPELLEMQLDDKIRTIQQLEMKLRQREEAIDHLEQALEMKTKMLDTMRHNLESSRESSLERRYGNGDTAGGMVDVVLEAMEKPKVDDLLMSLKERTLKNETVFASIKASLAA